MNTWDEKNYIEPKKNYSNKIELESLSTISKTERDLTENEWKDIGGVKFWKRNCPKCSCDIWIKSKKLLKSKRLCKNCGYSVDGYDKEKNIIVEYDEPHHYSVGTLKQKDIDRMNKVIHHLKCKFYRYNEKVNKLIKYE